MHLPIFQTARLILRAPTDADIPSWERHFVDYEVIRHLTRRVPWPYPADGVRDYFMSEILPDQGISKWAWGIFTKGQPDGMIGGIDLRREPNPSHRGFWLGHKHWGRGYMTEAVAPVMDYAFGELGFEKLRLDNALGNDRSRRIKEKTGARLIGIEPAEFVDPAYTEHEIWELTRADWISAINRNPSPSLP